MIPFQKSIGFRLLGVSFILLALPLLVDSFVLIHKRYQQTIADAKQNLIEIAHLRELPFSQLQFLNRPTLELLTLNLELEKSFPEKPSEELNQKLKKIAEVGGFHNISLIKITSDNQYIVVASGLPQSIGDDDTNLFRLNQFNSPSTLQKGMASYISFNNQTLEPYFIIAHTIYSFKEGRNVGVLAISSHIESKLNALLEPDTRTYHVNFALLFPSSIIFAATDPRLRFQYFLPLNSEYRDLFIKAEPYATQYLPANPLPVGSDFEFPFFQFTWKDEEQIGYITSLPGSSHALLCYASKNAIFQTPLIHFFNTYSVYGFILVLGGTFALLVTMRMARPIQRLSLVMQKIQEGELDLRYQNDPFGFEINTLGSIFNGVVDAVLAQKHLAEEERIKREVFAQELRLGRQVQRNLFPSLLPKYAGVELAEKYIPATEVGGDFYDVFIKENEKGSHLVLAIADVSGKGVQACFYSLGVRNMLRIYAREYPDIAEAMSAVNDLFRKDTGESGMFVTVLAGVYDAETKILRYCSNGHNPGLIRRQNGYVEALELNGIAMGVLPSENTTSHQIQLNPGDTLLFYTDGITEAHNEEYQFFNEERLMQCFQEEGGKNAAEINERIVNRVNEFVGKAPQHDDITLLVMKIKDD